MVPVQRDERPRALAGVGHLSSSTTRSRPRCSPWPRRRPRRWVWRCHIDVSTPNPQTMERLLPYITGYAPSLFHVRRTCRRGWTAASTSSRRRSTRWRRRTWRSRPRTRRSSASSSASTSSRPLICQVSRFDPWKDPLGVIDAYRTGEGGAARRAARAGRLDGDRRPRGLGLLQLDARARRRRSGHPHPQQLQQRRGDRGQRVPVARRRRDPEVDARGLRADASARRSGRAARSSAATSAGSRCRSRTARPGTWSPRSRSAPQRALEILKDPALGKALGRRGKEHVREHFLTPALPARLSEDLPRGVVDARS